MDDDFKRMSTHLNGQLKLANTRGCWTNADIETFRPTDRRKDKQTDK